jgi:dimethylargininase
LAGKAFTRAVSPKLADCELTHFERLAINPVTASAQHACYEQALREAGFEVTRLPALPEHADGVFVEDVAVLLDDHAIITRPGAASRANEVNSTASALAKHFEVHWLGAGTLDGGDVLRIGRKLHVGLSSRTSVDGIAGLRNVVSPLGFEVVATKLSGILHLKSAATVAGHDADGKLVLLYNPAAVDPDQFAGVEPFAVNRDEADAANVLRAGEHIIMPAGYPKTVQRLSKRGFNVVEVDVSEFEKAEAGVTCMSLINPVHGSS